MSLAWRRHFGLILLLFLVIFGCLSLGTTRIIAYNFGTGQTIEIKGKNYDNDLNLFDDTVIHEIKIGLTQAEYEEMVRTYQELGLKDYYRTYVNIDGVTIPDVGIRLKGNLTLRQTLGGSGNGQEILFGGPNGDEIREMRLPPGMVVPENWDLMTDEEKQAFIEKNRPDDHGMRGLPDFDLPDNWEAMTDEERQIFATENGLNGPLRELILNLPVNWESMTDEEKQAWMQENNMGAPMMGGMGGEGNGDNPPFLLKFNEFINGQSYQGYTEIAVRIGSDASLLSEPVAFYIHKQVSQIVPETAFAVVETAENTPSLYVICEHFDENYVKKYFPETDGILYKAGNFVGFEYLGEDPTLYTDIYEQKTKVNDQDLAPLIKFLQFVSEASDKEFEQELPKWLHLPSFIRMLALDNLLDNNDSFTGMGSNYYLFYDRQKEQFTMLSWDLNLVMGGMGGGGRWPDDTAAETTSDEEKQAIEQEWLNEGGFNLNTAQNLERMPGGGPGGRGSTNTLKERFLANETFNAMYAEEYERLQKLIFAKDLILAKINTLAQVFRDYNTTHNIIDQSEYEAGVTKLIDYIMQKQVELKSEDTAP